MVPEDVFASSSRVPLAPLPAIKMDGIVRRGEWKGGCCSFSGLNTKNEGAVHKTQSAKAIRVYRYNIFLA